MESVITLGAFGLFLVNKKRRDRQILQYIQSASNTLEATSQGESPLPAVLARLGDGGIIWANHRFSELTGYADSMMEQNLRNEIATYLESIGDEVSGEKTQKGRGKPIKSRDKIVALLAENGKLSAAALAEKIGITSKAVEKHLANLKADGIIERIGPAKGGYWRVRE